MKTHLWPFPRTISGSSISPHCADEAIGFVTVADGVRQFLRRRSCNACGDATPGGA